MVGLTVAVDEARDTEGRGTDRWVAEGRNTLDFGDAGGLTFGVAGRLELGVTRGASRSPSSTIHLDGCHSVAFSPQTLGLKCIPVPLIEILVP